MNECECQEEYLRVNKNKKGKGNRNLRKIYRLSVLKVDYKKYLTQVSDKSKQSYKTTKMILFSSQSEINILWSLFFNS